MGCYGSKVASSVVETRQTRPKYQKITKKLTTFESILDYYELQETIELIPYGSLVKAVHKPTRVQKLIKITCFKLNNAFSLNNRHLRIEVDTLANLNHPNLLEIFDILYDNVNLFIVMEYWPGKPVIEEIKSLGEVSEKIVKEIIIQLLNTIKFCHEKNVLHRDLSPMRIFIAGTEGAYKIKVAEFGASVFIDPEHKLEGKFSESLYCAPEIRNGNYNEKCDLWSVGMIMFTLLTGCTPYNCSLLAFCSDSSITQIIDCAFISSQKISNEAVDLILNLLELDYNKRYSAADALNHTWIASQLASPKNLPSAYNKLISCSSGFPLLQSIHEFLARPIALFVQFKEFCETLNLLNIGINKESLCDYYKNSMPINDALAFADEVYSTYESLDRSSALKRIEEVHLKKSRDKLMNALKVIKIEEVKVMLDELKGIFTCTALNGDLRWLKFFSDLDTEENGLIEIKKFGQQLLAF